MSLARNMSNKYWTNLLANYTKTGLDAAKTASIKVVHKTDEAGKELIRNKIADNIVKPKPMLFHHRKDKKI